MVAHDASRGRRTRTAEPAPRTRAARPPARTPVRPTWSRLRHARAKFDEQLPVDHRLSRVYRVGAGLMGLVLLVFGIIGLAEGTGFFSSGDTTVAGLRTNGALSALSIAVGLVLFAGMVVGGNTASHLNMLFGLLFLLSGFINLGLLETAYNELNFGLENVLFSYAVGLVLLVFGMYGRVGGRLPHDNPYWRARHPEQAAREGQGTPPEGREARPGGRHRRGGR